MVKVWPKMHFSVIGDAPRENGSLNFAEKQQANINFYFFERKSYSVLFVDGYDTYISIYMCFV